MTGDYKKLGETIQNDPKLKGRVVIAKVNIMLLFGKKLFAPQCSDIVLLLSGQCR